MGIFLIPKPKTSFFSITNLPNLILWRGTVDEDGDEVDGAVDIDDVGDVGGDNNNGNCKERASFI